MRPLVLLLLINFICFNSMAQSRHKNTVCDSATERFSEGRSNNLTGIGFGAFAAGLFVLSRGKAKDLSGHILRTTMVGIPAFLSVNQLFLTRNINGVGQAYSFLCKTDEKEIVKLKKQIDQRGPDGLLNHSQLGPYARYRGSDAAAELVNRSFLNSDAFREQLESDRNRILQDICTSTEINEQQRREFLAWVDHTCPTSETSSGTPQASPQVVN